MSLEQLIFFALFAYACWYFYQRVAASRVKAADAPEPDLEVQRGIAQKILTRSDGWESLPVFESNFELEPGEVAHLEVPATLVGLRVTQSTTVYHGATVRLPIAGGVSYRAGAITRSTAHKEDWCLIDEGGLCVTNRRVFFHGIKGNSSLRLNKVIRTYGGEPDVVRLDRDTGKPFVVRSKYALMITAMVQRLLADQREGIVSDHFSIDDAAAELGILPAR